MKKVHKFLFPVPIIYLLISYNAFLFYKFKK
jgi:hypothetical protein